MVRNSKGITLIVLVITIVVLLILAGVTLSFVAGENGIIGRATKAVDRTEITGAREDTELLVSNFGIEYYEEKYVNRKENLGKIDDYIEKKFETSQETEGKYMVKIANKKVEVSKGDKMITKGKLEDGKIFWDTKGIVLNKSSLTLMIGENGEMPTEEIMASLFEISGTITWKSSNAEIATVSGNGEIATIIAVAKGKTTITVSCEGYTASCAVIVAEPLESEEMIGGFVHYDVPYTDAYYDEYEYTADNGWRIMNFKNNGNGIYDVDIISTGIPAGLCYYWGSIKNFEKDTEGTLGKWAGDSMQRLNYKNDYQGGSDDWNMFAASGLFYNFEKIILNGINSSSVEVNYGFFKNIKGQFPSENVTGSIFREKENRESKIIGIRSVILSDFGEIDWNKSSYTKDKAIGLFNLPDLCKVTNSSVHDVSTKVYDGIEYWVANPATAGGRR